MQQAVRRFAVALTAPILSVAIAIPAVAQKRADKDADTSVASPAYPLGAGPVVFVDAGHDNYHTIDGLYAPFAAVLRADGYRVQSSDTTFSAESLKDARLLVIANADNPAGGSAFTDDEIAAVRAWIEGGGALFMVADHMPYAGTGAALAKSFGFTIATDKVTPATPGMEMFTRDSGMLADSPIADGDDGGVPIGQIRTFHGSAITAPPGAIPLLRMGKGWKIGARAATPDDLCGAALRVGAGRVTLFCEAATFSAMTRGVPMGFNAPGAEQNKQFLLNVLRWLTPPVGDNSPEPVAAPQNLAPTSTP